MLSEKFIDRIVNEIIVDTKKYRYRLINDVSRPWRIERICINQLDTTATLNRFSDDPSMGWQTVAIDGKHGWAFFVK